MIDKLIKDLDDKFSHFKVYTSEIRQGFTKPCITILMDRKNITKQMNNRYTFSYHFTIDIYTDEIYKNLELKLLKTLNIIDNTYRATDLTIDFTKDKISASVTYSFINIIKNDDNFMNKMEADLIEKRK